jgi:hypothetical protein
MIKKLRTIVLGTVAIAAVIALFATGPEVGQVWSQVANADINIVNTIEIHENNGEIANHIKAFPPFGEEPEPEHFPPTPPEPELEPHH